MPTAIIKPVSLFANTSDVTNTEYIYTSNDTGVIIGPAVGTRTADYNTDATSVLPVGAIITHWKVRMRHAITPVTAGVYPVFAYKTSLSVTILTDFAITSGFTTRVYPDPAGSFPDGYAISSNNTPADFSRSRIGIALTGTSAEVAYIDFYEIEVTYTTGESNIHLLMGDF